MAYIHKVQYYETDKMQITHHSNYIRFMEEARVHFLECVGYSYQQMEKDGLISPVVAFNVEYKKPTTFGDEIEIFVRVKNVSFVKLEIEYKLVSKEEIVCLAQSVHCFVDKNMRPLNLKKDLPKVYEIFSNQKQQNLWI